MNTLKKDSIVYYINMNLSTIISNFRILCVRKTLPIMEITKLLSSSDILNSDVKNMVQFNNQFPCRKIIYTEPGLFSLHVLGFKPDQSTEICPYYNLNTFYVVLDGSIVEYVYYKPFFETKKYINTTGCTSYITDKFGYHQLQNLSDKDAILFQLFT